jgi:hypothetical protein
VKDSTRSDGGRAAVAAPALASYANDYVYVKGRGRDYYSCFGEVKIHKDVVDKHWSRDHAKIPFKELYLTVEESDQGINNENFLMRDLCLYTMEHREIYGFSERKKLSYSGSSGCMGPGPFKGVFLFRPSNFRIKYNGRSLVARPVPERGDKSRVITVSDWEDTTIMNLPRIALYHFAAMDKEIPTLDRDGKAPGNPLIYSIGKWARDSYGPGPYHSDVTVFLDDLELLSLDLSRCSDLILPSLSRELLTGFSEGTGLVKDPFYRELYHFCETTPTLIDYPDIDVYNVNKKGGPLMGDPPTWFIDNAYTKFVSWLARTLASFYVEPGDIPNMAFMELNVLIHYDKLIDNIDRVKLMNDQFRKRCGDDEIALDTPQNNDMVIAAYPALGGKVSEGTNLCSEEFGIYCESSIRRGDSTHWFNILEYSDIVRVKNITKPDAARFPGAKEVPPEWTRGSSAQATLKWFSEESEEFKNAGLFVYLNNRDFINRMKVYGHHPFLPLELGGMGYPNIHNDAHKWVSDKMSQVISFLAQLGPELLRPSAYLELGSISNLFSLEVVGNPYAEDDQRELENMLFRLDPDHRSFYDLLMMDHEYSGDERRLRIASTRRTNQVVLNDGSGHSYIPMVFAMSEIRTRLINRRGLCALVINKHTIPSLPKLGRKLNQWYRDAAARLDICLNVTPSFDRDCVGNAVKALYSLQMDTYVRYDLIETYLPVLSKGIPIKEAVTAHLGNG